MFTTTITEFHAAAKFTEAKSICENKGNQLLMVRNSQKENQLSSYHLNGYVACELVSICIELTFLAKCNYYSTNKTEKMPVSWQILFFSSFSESIWLGLTDETIESVFRWVDGDIITWGNWFPGEPNGRTSQNCVIRTPNGAWQDVDCEEQYRFYCEKSKISAVPDLG